MLKAIIMILGTIVFTVIMLIVLLVVIVLILVFYDRYLAKKLGKIAGEKRYDHRLPSRTRRDEGGGDEDQDPRRLPFRPGPPHHQ